MSLLKSIKEIGKDMSVYGISSILSQLVSLLLLPLYTQKLSPADYGIFALIGICVNGYAIFSNLGVSSAIFRFTGTSKDDNEKDEYLCNAQIINIISNVITLLLFLLISNVITKLIFNDINYIRYVYYIAIAGTLSSCSGIYISFLRVNRQTVKIAKSSLVNLVVSVSTTFVGLVYLNLGVWGALLGGLIGDAAAFIFLFLISPRQKLKLNIQKIKALMLFAIPIFPHKVIGFLLPIISQIILMKYMDLSTLGIYNIALKFALPLVLFVNLFQKAYAPYRFEIYKKGNTNTELFSKINLLYFMIIFIGYSTVVLFGDWILVVFTNVKFHAARVYIPFLALIPLTQSIYFAFGTGVEFSKSPKFYPIISFVGFVFIVISSVLLIPKYNIIGAALATISGWLIMALCMFIYAQKIFPIHYLWSKINYIILITFAVVALKYSIQNNWFSIPLLILQIGVYAIILKPYINSLKHLVIKQK